jgi:uncharacterized MAPEG superfamily protein
MKASTLIPAAAVIAAFFLPQAFVPLPFLALAIIWIAAALEGQTPVIYGACLWLACGAIFIFNETLANQIASIGFWAIAAGCAAILFRMAFPKANDARR